MRSSNPFAHPGPISAPYRAAAPLKTGIIRVVAFNPRMSNGERVNTILSPAYSAEQTATEICAGLVAGLGDGTYTLEGGSPQTAIRYVEAVPYQRIANPYNPYTQDVTNPRIDLTGNQFSDLVHSRGPWPYDDPSTQGNACLAAILDPSLVGFNLVEDANAGLFTHLIIYGPGADPNQGGWHGVAESWMAADRNDADAFALNGGLFRVDSLGGLQVWDPPGYPFSADGPISLPVGVPPPSGYTPQGQPVGGTRLTTRIMMSYSNFATASDQGVHSICHAWLDAGILRMMWRPPAGEMPSSNDIYQIQTPLGLWMLVDDETALQANGESSVAGESHVGITHRVPNAFQGDYDMDDHAMVPCNAGVWAGYPDGGPWIHGQLDLGNNQRRIAIDNHAWDDDPRFAHLPDAMKPYAWKLAHLPRGVGQIDGRWCDWRRYLLDLNDQTGRGMPVTLPVRGPATGGRDLTLTVDASRGLTEDRHVTLRWRKAFTNSSSDPAYAVYENVDGQWNELKTYGQIANNDPDFWHLRHDYDCPPDGKIHYIGILWNGRVSDILAFIPGSASGTPPAAPSVALYQGSTLYGRCQIRNPGGRGSIVMTDYFTGAVADAADVTPGTLQMCLGSDTAIGVTIAQQDATGAVVGTSDVMGALRGASQV